MFQHSTNSADERTREELAGPFGNLRLTERVIHGLLKLNNRMLVPFSTHLERRYDITLNEFRLLMLVGMAGETASHELVHQTGLNSMSVSRGVAALVRRQRAVVRVDPHNRRRKIISLTPAGEELFRKMAPAGELVENYLFEDLRIDELMALDRYISSLIAKLEATDEYGRSLFLERTKPADSDCPLLDDREPGA
ncbi:MAG: MarR family winged helix-turn-helix transcriptional regulator [Spongiibacteraceae bacterium]|jgi:DNA-binding MarR family transcriptional regulator|nr:MarR family winged helix-turn-helix transcriptional regulator [Spongiibacteraceae bacterium]